MPSFSLYNSPSLSRALKQTPALELTAAILLKKFDYRGKKVTVPHGLSSTEDETSLMLIIVLVLCFLVVELRDK